MTRGVSDIPSIYAGMQSSTAVLRKGDDVADTPRHPDGVAYATSPSNEARRVVRLTFDTRLASGLGRACQKYVFVPYRELAYVTNIQQHGPELPRRSTGTCPNDCWHRTTGRLRKRGGATTLGENSTQKTTWMPSSDTAEWSIPTGSPQSGMHSSKQGNLYNTVTTST